MKQSSLKSTLLLCTGVTGALFFSSCVVTDYPSVYRSPGYQSTNYQTVATIPTGLIRTSSSYWFYDPFRRSYYDTRNRAYYNYLTSRYYTSPPTRYSTRKYPTYWNGQGVFPHPNNLTRYNSSKIAHHTNVNGKTVVNKVHRPVTKSNIKPLPKVQQVRNIKRQTNTVINNISNSSNPRNSINTPQRSSSSFGAMRQVAQQRNATSGSTTSNRSWLRKR